MYGGLQITSDELGRNSNSLVLIEFHRDAGGPVLLSIDRISKVVSAFAALTSRVSDHDVDFAVVDARQGSLVVRLLPFLKDAHGKRTMIAEYAQILSLPIALLALFGVGSAPVEGSDPAEAQQLVAESPYAKDLAVKEAFSRLPQSVAQAGVDFIVIRIPDVAAIEVRRDTVVARKLVKETLIKPRSADARFQRDLIVTIWQSCDVMDVSRRPNGEIMVTFEEDMGVEGALSVEDKILRTVYDFEKSYEQPSDAAVA